MTPELAYFLKINVGIALFYAFYRLFFYKDTFFHWRRTALLCFFGISLLYPMLNIQGWIKAHEPMVEIADIYATVVLPEFTPEASSTTNWYNDILPLLQIIYWSGVILVFIRFGIQLASIIRLRIQCKPEKLQNTRIYVLNKASGPFSFFQWIFIHKDSHTQKELEEILTHELTHVRQRHSVDVILGELMCIVCWFNPFIWLMKREIRKNLEYMADNHVIQTGHDYKSYQYHLLGLAHHKAAANLYNSFNVLPLKNRIKMMNKKRTKEIGRTKYLVFLPLAALLMIISNIEVVARTTKNLARDVIQAVEIKDLRPTEEVMPAINADSIIPPKKNTQKKEAAKAVQQESAQNKDSEPDNIATFPGGQMALSMFLSKNIRYPQKAMTDGTQGNVIVQFTVEEDGSITNSSIYQGISPELDAAAMYVISLMPKWTPATLKGKPIKTRITVPIAFRLSGAESKEIKNSKLDEVVVVAYGTRDNSPSTDTETVLEVADEMPKFNDGVEGLMKYLARNIKYPIDAQKKKLQGRVLVQFVVNQEGSIVSPTVVQSVSPSLDAEALRVVLGMPRWIPGKTDGKPVSVKYTIPINFHLQP